MCERRFESGTEVVKPLLKTTKSDRHKVSFVQSKYLFDTTLRRELKGRMDPWACEIRGRVEAITCVRSYDAVYHRHCFQCFYKGQPKPSVEGEVGSKKQKRLSTIGSDDKTQETFIQVTEWLEQCEDQYITLTAFHQKMKEIVDEPYSIFLVKTPTDEKVWRLDRIFPNGRL